MDWRLQVVSCPGGKALCHPIWCSKCQTSEISLDGRAVCKEAFAVLFEFLFSLVKTSPYQSVSLSCC